MTEARRIDALDAPPLPGAVYLVPTITYPWAGKAFAWPVLEPLHTDAELGFDVPHWQVDGRFTTAAMNEFAYSYILANYRAEYYHESLRPRSEQAADCAATIALIDDGRNPMPTEPVWREMRCNLGVIDRIWRCADTIEKVRRYIKNPVAVRRNGRLLCPHKGADLTNTPVDCNGFARCPMHQLLVKVTGE